MDMHLNVHWTIGLAVALLFALIIIVQYTKHLKAKKKTDEQYRKNGAEGILKNLEGGDIDSREQAAQLLGEKKEKKAINSLVRIISKEEDADLLSKTAQALIDMEDDSVLDQLVHETGYSDPGNKWWACYVLEKLAEKGLKKDTTVDFLVESMKETGKMTSSGFPYDSGYQALKKITGKDFGKDVSKWISWRNS